VTRGALYHHYADKAERYLAVIGETWWDVTAPVFSALEGTILRSSGSSGSWPRTFSRPARTRGFVPFCRSSR
jgi:AcrR family transcriptional regulator